MRGTNDGESFKEVLRIKFFGCSHVDEIDFSLGIDYWIFRFEVSIDKIIRLKVLDGKEKATNIIFNHFRVHRLDLSNNIKHFFAMNVLHDQIDILAIMKCFYKPHNIRKYYFLKDSLLCYYRLLELLLLNVLLVQTFYCIQICTKLNIFC